MDMRRNLMIGSGIIILALMASFILQPSQKILQDENGQSYISLSKKEAVLNYQANDLFVVSDHQKNTADVYKIIGFPSQNVSYAHLGNIKEIKGIPATYETFINSLPVFADEGFLFLGKSNIDTISKVDFKARKAIFKSVDKFEGRRYVAGESTNTDWFTRIDDSIFVFLLIAFIPFLIMMLHDLILYFIKAQAFSKKYYGLQIIMLILTVLFFFNMVTPQSYAASNITAFIKYTLLFFFIYFIYQKLIKGILKDEQAYKKAIILFALCIICSLGSTLIARLIDQYVYSSDGFTDLATRPIYFELGFLFSFTLGNFFNNLRKNYFKHRRRSKALDSSQERALVSEAELNSIQASVNPHFLYNSLNAIASLAKDDPTKTEAMALALSKFYKYQTNRNGKPLSTLKDELEMLDNYLAIEKIRFGERLQYQLEIDEQSKSKKVPHFLLQPLLENAIKYGYNDASEKIDILLKISLSNNKLKIQLFDQGVLFSENLNSGYGLKSVMKKLQLFYPETHSIDFINQPKKHVAINIEVSD